MLYSLGKTTACLVCVMAFPARAQPLPTDPGLTMGDLPNGLHYVIKRNANPPGRAVVWLHMHSGSLNETDRQRGIAHYLEHMAFNGSEHFKPGTLVPFFESLGMQFGRDQNAFTNMTQTTFQLSLPKADADTLGKGMSFFSDVVSGLSLTKEEVDNARQIILEERRRGLGARQRTNDAIIARIAPGSVYAVRETIGLEETIKGVVQQDFRDYYGKWYCASNATLMVVADADPAEVAKVVGNAFAAAPKRERPTAQALNVKAYDTSFAIVATDPELRAEEVRIVHLEPAHPPVTTVDRYRQELVLSIAESALNQRLGDKVARGGMSYLSARVSRGNESNAIHTTEISGRASIGKWKPALEEMALDLQRARAFGFSAHDIDDVKKELVSGAERAVETEGTITSQAIVNRLNGAVTSGEPIMSPTQRLELLKELLPTITAEECSKAFAAAFEPKAVAYIAVVPSGPNAPSESQLLDIGTKALAVTPTEEAEVAHATTLLAKAPAPGKVAEGSEHTASQVWSGWLSNNVRVHHRFMDERKNEVSVRVSLIGGELLETAENRGITQAAQLAWSRPTTKSLTSADIRELMNGKKVSVRGGGGFGGGRGGGGGGRGGGGGGGGPDSISLSISGSPDELETGFQLAYLLLTEPKVEPSAFEQWQSTTKQILSESMMSPMALGARTAASVVYPDDARVQPLKAEQVERLSAGQAQAWLDRLIKESPVEVTIVGDLSRERAMELAAKYLGALPQRDRVAPTLLAKERVLKRPSGARVKELVIDTPTEQAFVYSGFYGADEANAADAHALAMAARILSMRMVKEVREEAQLVYSISAGSRAATTFPGFGVFSASAPTEPVKVAPLVAKLHQMYAEFAKNGPTEDEMTVAKKQMATTFAEQIKDPAFWAGRLNQMTFRGRTLDELMAEPEAFQKLTAEQVKGAFAKYCTKDNEVVVTVKPKGDKN